MTYSANPTNNTTATWSYWLNLFALAAVCGSLLEAFYYQIALNELPCPLCQLQRVALTLAGIGMMLNLRFGPSTVHYAIILASALAGAVASVRQVLLHIAPGDKGYGSELFGLHFYTWGLISFFIMMIFCAVMLCIDQHPVRRPERKAISHAAGWVIILFCLIALANMVSSVMVCQFGACPDNPTQYLWKI